MGNCTYKPFEADLAHIRGSIMTINRHLGVLIDTNDRIIGDRKVNAKEGLAKVNESLDEIIKQNTKLNEAIITLISSQLAYVELYAKILKQRDAPTARMIGTPLTSAKEDIRETYGY